MRPSLPLLIAPTALLTGCQLFQPEPPPEPWNCSARVELSTIWASVSRRHDADGDGTVTRAEYTRGEARFAMSAHGAAASLTRGPHHLVLNLRDHHEPLRRKRVALEVELYHLGEDPECLVDVHARDLELTRGLLEELITWLNTRDAPVLFERRQRTREENLQLTALGYAGDEAPPPTTGWLPAGTTPTTILERQ